MTDFCPVSWPEEPTPDDVKACEECGLYKHGSRMVWGEGNPEAPIMIVLDNPGARENYEGKPFVCGTRQTLQMGVNDAGLSVDDLYVTYILKRKPTRSYDKEQTRQICMNHLSEQLQNKNPVLVLCLGNVAVQSFFQNPDVDVKTLRGTLQEVHGYPTMAAYHPLAVRRRPNLERLFKEDLTYVANQYRAMK